MSFRVRETSSTADLFEFAYDVLASISKCEDRCVEGNLVERVSEMIAKRLRAFKGVWGVLSIGEDGGVPRVDCLPYDTGDEALAYPFEYSCRTVRA